MADQTVRIEDNEPKARVAYEMAQTLFRGHPSEDKEAFLDLVKECMKALNTRTMR